jgi:hypothetical protein
LGMRLEVESLKDDEGVHWVRMRLRYTDTN